jgi:two-component system LytT family response regulator
MLPIRTLIVDDESLACETIRRLLERDAEISVVGECADGEEASRRIGNDPPDLLFLDVQMPEVDGFELLHRVGPGAVPAVILVTAHEGYALRAFEEAVLDYLLKPFDDERFYRTLERAKSRVREHRIHRLARGLVSALDGVGPAAQPAYAERIPVRGDGRVHFVRVDDVDWIEAADYCVRIHVGGRFHLVREPLRDLAGRLDPRRFFRLHRSAIVNLSRIRELEPHFHGEYVVVMQDGTRLRTSRSRRDELHRRLGLAR